MTILVIDDEPLIRRSLQRALTHMGHHVEEAADAIIGKEKWLQLKPEVVFLDVLMPKKTGPELLKEMQGLHQSKVILISAYTGEYNESLEQMGAHLFLKKPFENVFTEIEKALQIVSTN